jgi:transcriptional regulator with XRE-family HTH domain
MMNTGQFIREQRLKKGMTQEDLAAKTDVSARTIQRIENAEVAARAYTLQNIASALQIDFGVLNELSRPALVDDDQASDHAHIWLPLLHLSGLFNLLLPPMIIWLMKRDRIINMREHGVAVLNFQLSMLLYEVVCGLFLVL